MLDRLDRWRTWVNFRDAPFETYSLQGKPQKDLLWHNISYDEATGSGFFLVRFAPGAVSIAHEHLAFEEFVVLEGEFVEHDGTVYRAGDCVSLAPGSRHFTRSDTGAVAAVFVRGGFRTLDAAEIGADAERPAGTRPKARKGTAGKATSRHEAKPRRTPRR